MTTLDRDAALAFLTARIDYEREPTMPYRSREFKLDRMRELLRRLGNPQDKLPVIHIAGTKGKGSTARMIASVLRQSNYHVGLYTSPHLEHLEERFLVDDEACSESELTDLLSRVAVVTREMDDAADETNDSRPTYFEITTAVAMLLFAERGVDFAVLEVGLGGRLDSTNVCNPLVTIITSISLDHTRQLGSTLDAIAAEKAGIVKPNVPMISGVCKEPARSVIADHARRVGAPLVQRQTDFDIGTHTNADGTTTIDYHEPATNFNLHDVQLRLLGAHQAANAAVAIAAIRDLMRQGHAITNDAIREGLVNTNCPARIEVIHKRPYIVVDAAHNVASTAALTTALSTLPATQRTIILATSKDKDLRGMLRELLAHFNTVICTRYLGNPRSFTPQQVVAIANEVNDELQPNAKPTTILSAETPTDAWELAIERMTPESLLCVSGSFFIAAELRPTAIEFNAD